MKRKAPGKQPQRARRLRVLRAQRIQQLNGTISKRLPLAPHGGLYSFAEIRLIDDAAGLNGRLMKEFSMTREMMESARPKAAPGRKRRLASSDADKWKFPVLLTPRQIKAIAKHLRKELAKRELRKRAAGRK